jgi:hypothetical protein
LLVGDAIACAAFGHDGIGTAGSPTTINSGDLTGILMSAVQELAEQNLELRSDNAAIKARLDSLEQLIRSDHGSVLSLVESRKRVIIRRIRQVAGRGTPGWLARPKLRCEAGERTPASPTGPTLSAAKDVDEGLFSLHGL